MFAKLFSRITESSLMEEPISVRYTFVLMLAIADPEGYVIGTDVAIARRLNMKLNEFKAAIEILMQPDPNSNSKEQDGRRIVVSNGERGYHVVNFVNYRDTKDPQQRREYMRSYMKARRSAAQKTRENIGETENVNNVNFCKPMLTQAEAEAEAEAEADKEKKKEKSPSRQSFDPRKVELPFSSDEFRYAWEHWCAHRSEIRKPLKPTSVTSQIRELTSLGESRAIAAIWHTIGKGWTGLREPESNNNGHRKVEIPY